MSFATWFIRRGLVNPRKGFIVGDSAGGSAAGIGAGALVGLLAGGPVGAVVGAAAGYGGSKYLEAQSKGARAQRDAMSEAQGAQDKLFNEAKSNLATQDSGAAANAARDAAKRKQQNAALSAVGKRDTILTSPLGLTDQPQTAGKTLLGA